MLECPSCTLMAACQLASVIGSCRQLTGKLTLDLEEIGAQSLEAERAVFPRALLALPRQQYPNAKFREAKTPYLRNVLLSRRAEALLRKRILRRTSARRRTDVRRFSNLANCPSGLSAYFTSKEGAQERFRRQVPFYPLIVRCARGVHHCSQSLFHR